MSQEATIKNVGFFLVELEATNEMVGAPALKLQLGVNPAQQTINGNVEIMTPISAEHWDHHIVVEDVIGEYCYTGFKKTQKVVFISGKYLAFGAQDSDLPNAYLAEFNATLSLDGDWQGTGSFTFHRGEFKDYDVTQSK